MTKQILLGLFAGALAFTACKKPDDGPGNENEEELITTVEMTFTKQDSTAQVITVTAVDLDGEGGDPIVIDPINLSAMSAYTLSLRFLNEAEAETEDVTLEVQEEAAEHLVCFGTDTNIGVTPTDSDGTYPIGLENTVTTADPISGTLTVSLKHQPDIKNGECGIGETDIEVTFPVTVQ